MVIKMINAEDARLLTKLYKNTESKLSSVKSLIAKSIREACSKSLSYVKYNISLNSWEQKVFKEYFESLGYIVSYDYEDRGNYQVEYFLELRW